MSDRTYNVLFLCTGNSARSIMAESILARSGKGQFRAYSAGSKPVGKVNPLALAVLERNGSDVSALRSKSWNEFATPEAPYLDFVFTLCDSAAGEACPAWPGQPMTAHWGIEDPAVVEGSDSEKYLAFVKAYSAIRLRVSLFVSVPIANLDGVALKESLDDIGRIP